MGCKPVHRSSFFISFLSLPDKIHVNLPKLLLHFNLVHLHLLHPGDRRRVQHHARSGQGHVGDAEVTRGDIEAVLIGEDLAAVEAALVQGEDTSTRII